MSILTRSSLFTTLLLAAFLCQATESLVSSVDSVSIPVSNVDRSTDFYVHVLHFHKVADREVSGDAYEHLFGVFGLKVRCVRLGLGDESIELQQFMAAPGRPLPADFHANDRWFQHVAIVVRDMDRAYASLREQNVSFASTAPQLLPAWNPNAGGISAFYFKDPDGNHLELIHFPAGKGQARWQYNTDLFMGIDHTAIVVADTEASLAFYRDLLGLEVAGTSENYGPEQEHLNNVFGAHLRITALRAAAGPGVELLEYLAPRTGRAYPSDTLASDRWHWQINMRANLHKASILTAPGKKIAWVSSYPIDLTDQALGYGRAFMIRDPDGHATNLEQQ